MNSGKVHLCIDSKTVIVDKDPEIEALLDNIPLRERTHGYLDQITYTCYAAVHKIKTNGFAILRVPEEFRTKKMLEDALDQNGLVLLHVPKPKRTTELCARALRQTPHAIVYVSLSHAKRDFRELATYENYFNAVKHDNNLFPHVPITMRDRTMYLYALSRNGMFLNQVPQPKRDRELCLCAVKQNPRAIEFVPERLIDYDFKQQMKKAEEEAKK